MDLPTMTRARAYKENVRMFKTVDCCKDCGSNIFYRPKERQSVTLCLECYPDIQHTSICNVNSSLSKHNKEARRKSNALWCLPKTLHGMNTVSR